MAERPEPLSRKTVTVLFCDVAESTSLGESVDPETTRRVMLRYFDEMRPILERHGGTVEKFIGDAVLGVFGIPVLHEDDALRAVRAAGEMRNAIERLNGELESRWGVRLQTRMGINTGEVVVGDPTARQTIASGDTFNVAARLQQSAKPGEILLGKETYRLVADRIRAGPLKTFSLKGKREGVPTWRLDEVRSSADRVFRRLDSPLVGRQQEQGVLHDVYRRALEDQTCELVTVFGAAGIGKTRLAQEFAARVFGATVAQGRCVPYGDGITFWPIVEIVRELAGISGEDPPAEARRRLAQLVPDGDDASLVCERVGGVIGLGDGARAEEAFWALRRLFEAVARRRPLVLVIEDVHWAEPTLLDLIDYLVGWSRGAPIMVLCLARPELLESRTSWAGEHTTTHALALEPLGAKDVGALLTNLLGSAPLERRIERRIAAAADGNPLFVEELVRMLVDEGVLSRVGDGWAVEGDLDRLAIPPSISALLTARLDQLDPEERTVLQCASVVGKQFWWSAVSELAPASVRGRVGTHLHSLVRKRLIAPDESTMFTSEDSFRFAHILIRDAAYGTLPKAQRAELHERFADWLTRKTGERRGEYEEILGHHLEQAFLARAELGPPDAAAAALAGRAGELLGSAGQRAFAREDMQAARTLLERAAALLPHGAGRDETLLALSGALRETGQLARAAEVLTAAMDDALAREDPQLSARVSIDQSSLRVLMDPGVAASDLIEVADGAVAVFAAAGDDLGLAKAWIHVAEMHWLRGGCADMERVLEQALIHAERARGQRELRSILRAMMRAALLGPRPVEDAIARCTTLRERARDDIALAAQANSMLAVLEAMQGDAETARQLYERSRKALEEAGLRTMLGSMQMYAGMAELVSGNAAGAERELRFGYELLDKMGALDKLSTTAAYLARALVIQRRYDEAHAVTVVSERSASVDDLASQVIWRGTRARVLARHDHSVGEELAREAVELSQETDLLAIQADALVDLANVLTAVQRDEAASALADAVKLYDAKGHIVGASRARRRLEELARVGSA